MMRLVCVGLVNVDLMLGEAEVRQPGGNLSHVAVALRGVVGNRYDIGLCAVIGQGFSFLDVFNGFDTEGFTYVEEPATVVTFSTATGQPRFRSISNRDALTGKLRIPETYASTQAAFVGAIDVNSMTSALRGLNAADVVVVNYSPWVGVREFSEAVQGNAVVLVLNRHELAEHFEGIAPESLRASLNCRAIVITKDHDGFEVIGSEGRITGRAPPVSMKWKYGAGAIFGSRLALGLADGLSMRSAAATACALASCYVAHGPIDFAPSRWELEEAERHVYDSTL